MKTVIDQLFKDIEKLGYNEVLKSKRYWVTQEETLIKSAWRNGRNSGLMGTFTNENEFYNNLISEENESN